MSNGLTEGAIVKSGRVRLDVKGGESATATTTREAAAERDRPNFDMVSKARTSWRLSACSVPISISTRALEHLFSHDSSIRVLS